MIQLRELHESRMARTALQWTCESRTALACTSRTTTADIAASHCCPWSIWLRLCTSQHRSSLTATRFVAVGSDPHARELTTRSPRRERRIFGRAAHAMMAAMDGPGTWIAAGTTSIRVLTNAFPSPRYHLPRSGG